MYSYQICATKCPIQLSYIDRSPVTGEIKVYGMKKTSLRDLHVHDLHVGEIVKMFKCIYNFNDYSITIQEVDPII